MNDVGTAPAVPPIPSHVPVDAGGFLEQDVQCRRCAYNLRGLKADGLCPECGIAVGLSTQRDLLRFADPGWLATVHRGTRLILWGLLVAILGGCVAHAAVSSTGNSAIGAIVVILSQVVALWGTWLLTEPDPSRVGDDRWSGTRQFVRYSIAASLVGSLLPIMEEFLHPPPMIGIVLTVIGVVLALVGAAGGVAQMLYLGSLAMRIPNPMIAGRCRFLAWTIGIFGIGTVLSSTVAFFCLHGCTATRGTPSVRWNGSDGRGGVHDPIFVVQPDRLVHDQSISQGAGVYHGLFPRYLFIFINDCRPHCRVIGQRASPNRRRWESPLGQNGDEFRGPNSRGPGQGYQ